jgi:hypothetical protein
MTQPAVAAIAVALDPYLDLTSNQLTVKVMIIESIRRVYREWVVLPYAPGNKFNAWKEQMCVLFEDAGVMDLLDGIHTKPPLENINDLNGAGRTLQVKRHELYDLKQCIIYSLLMRSIVDSTTGLTDKGNATKNEGSIFWFNLEQQNDKTEMSTDVMTLKRCFFQMKQYAKKEDCTASAIRIDDDSSDDDEPLPKRKNQDRPTQSNLPNRTSYIQFPLYIEPPLVRNTRIYNQAARLPDASAKLA